MNIKPINPEDIFFNLHKEKQALELKQKTAIPMQKTLSDDNKKLMDACEQFEALFLNMMMKEMRKTIPNDGFIPRGNEEEMFTGMFDEEVTKNIAKTNATGLAKMMFEQLRDKSQDNKKEFEGVIENGQKYHQIDGNN